MKKVFADTGYWIAILNPGDRLHQKARNITNSLTPLTYIINVKTKPGVIQIVLHFILCNKKIFAKHLLMINILNKLDLLLYSAIDNKYKKEMYVNNLRSRFNHHLNFNWLQ
jgi:hypothetical protein